MATSPIYSWPEPDNTDLVKNGALAIRTLGNAIDTTMGTMVAKTVVDAKGDLIAGTAADTVNRLAVGNNGETLVADSSTSTGLRYGANFAAGKNKIINGDMNIWQRGTSFTNPSSVYTADRFLCTIDGGTGQTITRQTFTPGTAPVSGYEGTSFLRATMSASSTFWSIIQKVEDVRVFAGQSVTFSFWAKASSAFTGSVLLRQNFGSGGSADVDLSTSVSVTTSWQRFTYSTTLGSMSGKTIGTNSSLQVFFYYGSGTIASNAVDTWGWQLEASSVATAFQTATGTLQGELAACQRYYWRSTGNGAYSSYANGGTISTTGAYISVPFPTQMRTNPSSIDFSNICVQTSGGTLAGLSTLTIDQSSFVCASLAAVTGSSWTANQPCRMLNNNNTAGYVGFSAEL